MLGEIKTPTVAELYVGDLAAVGNWVVANVRSSVAWPMQVETVDFRGHRVFLVPRSSATVVADGSTVTMYPFAAVNLPSGTAFQDGHRLLSHFLSSLSWVEGAGITVEHWSGGSRAHPMGESRIGGVVTSQFELDYFPDQLISGCDGLWPSTERACRSIGTMLLTQRLVFLKYSTSSPTPALNKKHGSMRTT